MKRLAGTAHRGGAFNSEVLLAISENLPSGDITTLETGCGKSSIMFSHMARRHFVFAYDDRGADGSSVDLVQQDPEFKTETTTWIFGPTQKTLPTFAFDDLLVDVILIDGPHGYPFPHFEYAILYDKLKPGGVLILDDVHIPSIGNMYDLLREDRMYEEIGVIATTGLLRRTGIEGVPPDGDHWYEQSYNYMRFPLPVNKYKPNRSVTLGSILDLTNSDMRARHVVKSIEPAFEVFESGVIQTTDIGATFEVELPSKAPEQLSLRFSYRSIHRDAAEGAFVSINGRKWPLAYAPDWSSAEFAFERPENGRVIVTLTHPKAIPEHDRQTKRYEFRRLGSFLKGISFAAAGAPGIPKDSEAAQPLSNSDAGTLKSRVSATLAEYAKRFKYSAAPGVSEHPYLESSAGEPISEMHALLPRKANWSIAELLAFEGAEFADAAAWALAGRPATADERLSVGDGNRAGAKVEFVVALDHANRKARNSIRVLDLGFGRRMWRTARFFERSGWSAAARITKSLFRNHARRLVERNVAVTAQIQHLQLLIRSVRFAAKKV
ncbi:MAG: class I SAM-dependent methyltransferase [Phyllobacteriaceae bacterium]|nr:class I SAM-dependent methyltransferase [Phyllobacteriaceae bacterium]